MNVSLLPHLSAVHWMQEGHWSSWSWGVSTKQRGGGSVSTVNRGPLPGFHLWCEESEVDKANMCENTEIGLSCLKESSIKTGPDAAKAATLFYL